MRFSHIIRSILLVAAFSSVVTTGEVMAQQSCQVFTLSPGPYSVGFKSVNQFDNSRSFAKYSAEGALVNKGGTRPIQTSIWYPAEKDNTAAPMLFEEYVDLVAYELGLPEMTPEVRTNAREGLRFFCDSPKDRFETELKAKTNAIRNAKPAEGSFPVIIYGPSFSSSSFENSVLFEYLASYGYIVVSSPCMGKNSRAMTMDQIGIDAQTDDMLFLISFAHGIPGVDIDKLAVMGFSWGGISDVFVKMRNNNVKAVVSLDGSIRFFPDLFIKSPYADSAKMNVPFLYLSAQNPSIEEIQDLRRDYTYNFYNSLRYSDAYLVTFNLLWHQNFCSNFIKLVERKLYRENESTQEEVNQGYELMCRYILSFFDAYLKDDKQALKFLQNKPEMNGIGPHQVSRKFKTAQPSPVGFVDFLLASSQAGFTNLSNMYTEMKKSSPDFLLKEEEIDGWGYGLLMRGRLREAIEIFRLNVELNPSSATVYASLGEAYMLDGKTDLAIKQFEKSLGLNPGTTWVASFLAKLKEKQ